MRAQAVLEFRCLHCRQVVPLDPSRSGVQNRNHCPYCLWSRHLDLAQAGDRLSACKAPMRPLGLTIKRSARRYGSFCSGELMLIHQCIECGKLSINRIAADDFAVSLLEVFESSRRLDAFTRRSLEGCGILPLQAADQTVVRSQLFGKFERLV
jgi:hypothetical protein